MKPNKENTPHEAYPCSVHIENPWVVRFDLDPLLEQYILDSKFYQRMYDMHFKFHELIKHLEDE